MITVTKLFIHPVKSLHRIELGSSRVTQRGLEHDRRWMLVDDDGVFLSQRSHAKMATIRPEICDGQLRLSSPGMPPLTVAIGADGPRVRVRVWSFDCHAVESPADVNAWFTDALGMSARLVYMPDDERR